MTTVAVPVHEAPLDQRVLVGNPPPTELTEKLLHTVWRPLPHLKWMLLVTGAGTALLGAAMLYTFLTGVGLWGNNIPVAWGFGIVNFVFWIGVGHAGTFISAFLVLLNQTWRASINRLAEAMTLFAVSNALLFPILHLGRPWFAYWLIPYPATMRVWPQFRSALPWDFFAVATYFTVSLLFWYVGLIPDLAGVRDAAPGVTRRRIYGVFALGWRGSARQWHHYTAAYGLLAGLATALVISVHTVVSFDFAITNLPGWHSTIFPPYFVAGAIFSGFAMVFTLLIPTRRAFRLERVITERHLDAMAKVFLTTSLIVAYSYIVEIFLAWRSHEPYERYTMLVFRPRGTYAPEFWIMMVCNVFVPQIFWSRRARTSPLTLFVASILVNLGMWTERFVLIITSQARDFLPSSWHVYVPTPVDGAILLGSFCFFGFLYLLFIRWVPFIAAHEIKHLSYELGRGAEPRDPPAGARAGERTTPVGEGLLAEFQSPSQLSRALESLREMGHSRLDAYSPHPVEGIGDALGLRRSVLSRFTLAGGVLGALTGYLGQWWISAVDYPLNVGGRPLHSAPAFIPVTFELTILFAALATVLGLFLKAHLGALWAPVDEAFGLEGAFLDRFWVAVTPTEESRGSIEERLVNLGALRVLPFGRRP